jgi:3-oxoacyl-[acyl-carrier-protein] synthase II
MRPFDANSSGFFVGEGAGAIVLESRRHAEARGAKAYAAYLGGAFAQQSWKQVIPDVRGARLGAVMQEALRVTGTLPREIDLVIPHGAATQLSDGYEAASLAEAFRGEREHAVATAFKPYFGHLLAANVVVETIAAMLALKNQCVPATLYTSPDRVKLPIPLATALTHRRLRTAMKISTGFTGHDAALVFRAEGQG